MLLSSVVVECTDLRDVSSGCMRSVSFVYVLVCSCTSRAVRTRHSPADTTTITALAIGQTLLGVSKI